MPCHRRAGPPARGAAVYNAPFTAAACAASKNATPGRPTTTAAACKVPPDATSSKHVNNDERPPPHTPPTKGQPLHLCRCVTPLRASCPPGLRSGPPARPGPAPHAAGTASAQPTPAEPAAPRSGGSPAGAPLPVVRQCREKGREAQSKNRTKWRQLVIIPTNTTSTAAIQQYGVCTPVQGAAGQVDRGLQGCGHTPRDPHGPPRTSLLVPAPRCCPYRSPP